MDVTIIFLFFLHFLSVRKIPRSQKCASLDGELRGKGDGDRLRIYYLVLIKSSQNSACLYGRLTEKADGDRQRIYYLALIKSSQNSAFLPRNDKQN